MRLVFLLVIPILLGTGFLIFESRQVRLVVNEKSGISLSLAVQERSEVINPWYDEDEELYYFFLPSFVKSCRLYLSEDGGKEVTINGNRIGWNDGFEWQEKTPCTITLSDESSLEPEEYRVVFMRSENLPAVFVEMESGSMDYVNADKMNEERGFIDIVKTDGRVDFYGRLNKITGRGNSTWSAEKKPYAFTLEDEASLCGMSKSKKWKLMALVFEGSKMNNMLVYNMAEALGIANTTDASWVDLYLNGKYNGIYMLNGTIDISGSSIDIHDLEKDNEYFNPDIEKAALFETQEGAKGYQIVSPDNISGGYLLEIDNLYMDEEECAFQTEFYNYYGNHFVIHAPKHPSVKEFEYIKEYIQRIETMIFFGNKEYKDYIDLDSIVKKYLIDEITLNADAGNGSIYFYKNLDDDLLYAGPAWDYDFSLGHNGTGDARTIYTTNYESSTMEYVPWLYWQKALYSDTDFREKMVAYYRDLLPYMEKMLEYTIDEYAEWIESSVDMDSIRWKKMIQARYPGNYSDWKNNVRYTKFFLAKRLNYLNRKWKTGYEEFKVPSNGMIHKVSIIIDDKIVEEKEVLDGETIEDLPYLEEENYNGWLSLSVSKPFYTTIPVYEDMEIAAWPK